jgi:hypothetical protein
MFFSVKYSVKIAGKVYTPCVCYHLPDVLIPTIEKMVKEGKAYTYDHRVAFQNGKVLEKKEASKVEEVHIEKPKKVKKNKKEEISVQEETTVIEESVPSPEEVADNLEEF